MSARRLSAVLMRERQLIERLSATLRSEEHCAFAAEACVAFGPCRHAAQLRQQLPVVTALREDARRAVAQELGLPADAPLGLVAARLAAPWSRVLSVHLDELERLSGPAVEPRHAQQPAALVG